MGALPTPADWVTMSESTGWRELGLCSVPSSSIIPVLPCPGGMDCCTTPPLARLVSARGSRNIAAGTYDTLGDASPEYASSQLNLGIAYRLRAEGLAKAKAKASDQTEASALAEASDKALDMLG